MKHAAPADAQRRRFHGHLQRLGVAPPGFLASYATAEAAIDELVRIASDELGAWNIRVNSVLPGLIAINLTAGCRRGGGARRVPRQHAAPQGWVSPRTSPPQCGFPPGPESGWITEVNRLSTGGTTCAARRSFDAYVRREHGPEWLPER